MFMKTQNNKFLSPWSETVLKASATRMNRGFSFEDSIALSVSEVLTKENPSDPEARKQILASGAEVKDYVAKFTKETGMSVSFLVGTLR
jgi:hypothetical protein